MAIRGFKMPLMLVMLHKSMKITRVSSDLTLILPSLLKFWDFRVILLSHFVLKLWTSKYISMNLISSTIRFVHVRFK